MEIADNIALWFNTTDTTAASTQLAALYGNGLKPTTLLKKRVVRNVGMDVTHVSIIDRMPTEHEHTVLALCGLVAVTELR